MNAKAGQVGGSIFLSSDRLASLSDTMFGVAMTLVATTLLPSVEAHRGSLLAMWRDMHGMLVSVVLSFAIAARYWVSQHQRLAMTASVTPFQTLLHLVFLFLIVLIPITTSLPGLTGAGAIRASVMLYGSHPDRAREPAALDRGSSPRRCPPADRQILSGARLVRNGAGSRRDATRPRSVPVDCSPCGALARPPHRAASVRSMRSGAFGDGARRQSPDLPPRAPVTHALATLARPERFASQVPQERAR